MSLNIPENIELDIEENVLHCNNENIHQFKDKLQNFPEVIAFIERLQDCIYRQRNLLLKLYSKLTDKPNSSSVNKNVSEKATQTEQNIGGFNESWKTTDYSKGNIVDEIKEVAEKAMQQTGFVYEATSGLYYDYNTGLYYNAELGLYYDGNKGAYYYYDKVSETFQFHSHTTFPKQSENENDIHLATSLKEESENNLIEDTAKRKSASQDDYKNNLDAITSSVSQLAISTQRRCALESASGWPPCLRVIVQDTEVEGLTIGSLFIVTYTGGTMGREGDHAITIPDINISKHHAKFSFSMEEDVFKIVDMGSRNGTYIDGERMSVALRESDPMPLTHGSVIRVGTTHLLCHVHTGQETCEDCEPGCNQVQHKVSEDNLESKEERHRSELRRLRKKFGLDKLSAKDAGVNLAPGYQDRADLRRKTVGSIDHNVKTQSASIHEPIENENKGFKMLAKMGWSKGQSLGKDFTKGVTEPILVEQRSERTGLGCDETTLPAPDPKLKQKNLIWKKTKQRYLKLEKVVDSSS